MKNGFGGVNLLYKHYIKGSKEIYMWPQKDKIVKFVGKLAPVHHTGWDVHTVQFVFVCICIVVWRDSPMPEYFHSLLGLNVLY